MKILVVGGGPAGLSFATLIAEANRRADTTVLERNAANEYPGWAVTLRDNALSFLGIGNSLAMRPLDGRAFYYRGERVVDLPNPPAGHLVTVSRAELTRLLRSRAGQAGVKLAVGADGATLSDSDLTRYDLVVAADGAGSAIRQRYSSAFGPTITVGRNRYAWIGTSAVFPKLTILLRDDEAPLLLWAYRYADNRSTLVVECSELTHARVPILTGPPEGWAAWLAKAFSRELGGAPILLGPTFRWQQFPTLTCRRLFHENVVLVGDAAHTTHFSQGFGTMFAFDDALALHAALMSEPDITRALAAYEASQQPKIERFQATSTASMQWSEALVAAAERKDEHGVRDFIAARWPNNAVTAGPLGSLEDAGRAEAKGGTVAKSRASAGSAVLDQVRRGPVDADGSRGCEARGGGCHRKLVAPPLRGGDRD